MRELSLTVQAMIHGISGGGKLKILTIYCVSRDLIIHCNENNLSWWLKNANYENHTKRGIR